MESLEATLMERILGRLDSIDARVRRLEWLAGTLVGAVALGAAILKLSGCH